MVAVLQPWTWRSISVHVQIASRFSKWLFCAAMIASMPENRCPLAKTLTASSWWPSRQVSASKSRNDSMSARCASSNLAAHPRFSPLAPSVAAAMPGSATAPAASTAASVRTVFFCIVTPPSSCRCPAR